MTSAEAATHSNAYVIHEFERRAYPVSEIPVRIGRDAANDIVLREGAVSRFNTDIRREGESTIISSVGSTTARVNGVPILADTPLTDGARIEIGSAVLTYTEKRLPIGVSVVERARKGDRVREDVINRRDTIKNPLIKGPTAEAGPDPLLRAKVLTIALIVVALLYLFGR